MLSAIVITRNAESTISRCLASLSFADDMIVVDSGSTDHTINLACQLGAKVFSRQWSGYGDQKNYGSQQAPGPWLLFVDADEQVPPALAKAISSLLHSSSPAHDFYWLRIVTVFRHRPLVHLYGRNLRLFKKDAGHWDSSPVHEQVVTNNGHPLRLGHNKSGTISLPLIHYSHSTVHSYLQKMHHYTSLDAARMVKTGLHRSGRRYTLSLFLPYHLAARQLIKMLFYRRGILDGFNGILWSLLSSYYEYEMANKYRCYSITPASNPSLPPASHNTPK